MKWQQPDSFEDMDEHDQPTEPNLPVFLPPSSATAAGTPTNAGDAIPMPKPYEHPFPHEYIQNVAPPNSPNSAPPSTYPVIPGSPVRTTTGQARRSLLPLFVGLFFVAVQFLLLLRFVLKLLPLARGIVWVELIYAISDLFVLPFRLLLANILPISSALELYTLIAILVYGLLSRILVRFLKVLLRSN